MTLKAFFVLTIATVSVSFFPRIGLAHNPENSKQELTPITLQLQWKHQFQFAGYYAAIEKGFYRDRGLEVTLLTPTDDKNPVENVFQGNAQFGVSSSDLLLWRAKGKPVVALAAIYQHSPFVFLTRKDIDNIHELAGKKVMIESHAAEILAYLQQEGVNLDQMDLLPHTYNPYGLINGEVDAMTGYSVDEPFLLQQAGIKYNIFNPRSGGIDFYGDILFSTEAYIKENPRQVRAFVEATQEGWQYALDHPDEIIQLIYQDYSRRHSLDHLKFEAENLHRLILPEVVEIGYMNPGRWQYIRDTYASLGMIAEDFPLKGFLYEDYSFAILRKNNWIFWLSLGLILSLIVISGISLVVNHFYRLNRAIRLEIDQKTLIEKELTVLEKRYRNLVENAPFPIIISRIPSGEITYVNPKAHSQFEMVPAQNFHSFTKDFYVNLSDRDHILEQLSTEQSISNYELQLKTIRGRQFWANVCVNVIDFDGEPASFVALLDITQRKELEQKLERMAMTDELTQVHNRRYFIEKGHQEIKRAQRYGVLFSLMMLDIDYFKQVNDTYGHDVGDRVLIHFVQLLTANLREIDIIGRLGGEEFGVILPNTDQQEAYGLAKRLRRDIANNYLNHDGTQLKITASIGLTGFSVGIVTIDQLLKQADIALYEAKEAGRDRVMLYCDRDHDNDGDNDEQESAEL
jgi:diguanylate cyclase (GGDEF)-like protein/PAS domain S-box-containing protein